MKKIYLFEALLVVACCLKEDDVKHQISHRIVFIVQLTFNRKYLNIVTSVT